MVLGTVRLKLMLICQLCCLWTAASSPQLQTGPNSSVLCAVKCKPRVILGLEL